MLKAKNMQVGSIPVLGLSESDDRDTQEGSSGEIEAAAPPKI